MKTKDFILLGAGYAAGRLSKKINAGPIGAVDKEKAKLKRQIKELAKKEKISFIQAASAFQSAAAKLGDEKIIKKIAEIKRDTSEYKAIFK